MPLETKLRVRRLDDGAIEVTIPAGEASPPMGVRDELVPLADCGIEIEAARGLERRGLLRVVRIGGARI